MVACANNVGFGARHTKLLRSHSGTGVRVRLLRLTYALLILLSTNGSNKALAVAHRFGVQAVVISAGGGGVGDALVVSGDEEFEEEESEEEAKLEVMAEVGTERCGCHRGRRR